MKRPTILVGAGTSPETIADLERAHPGEVFVVPEKFSVGATFEGHITDDGQFVPGPDPNPEATVAAPVVVTAIDKERGTVTFDAPAETEPAARDNASRFGFKHRDERRRLRGLIGAAMALAAAPTQTMALPAWPSCNPATCEIHSGRLQGFADFLRLCGARDSAQKLIRAEQKRLRKQRRNLNNELAREYARAAAEVARAAAEDFNGIDRGVLEGPDLEGWERWSGQGQ